VITGPLGVIRTVPQGLCGSTVRIVLRPKGDITVRYHQRLLVAAAGFLALLGIAAAAPPAQAASRTAPHQSGAAQRSLYAPSALVLSLGYGEDARSVQRAVMLRCTPRGGDHPNVTAACAALGEVDGDFTALSGDSGACTREYNPVTVTVDGVWRGRHTHYGGTFSNPCMLVRAKGPVFEF